MSEAAFKPNVGQISASATHRGCVADSALIYTAIPTCESLFETGELRRAIDRHIGGGTPSRSISSYWNGGIPWASVKDFEDGQLEISATQETITSAGLGASASNLIPAGIPVVCTRMAVGRAALTTVPMAINQDVKALFPALGVHPRHLLRLLHYAQRKADATSVGSTVKGIRVQDYLSIVVPQAPTKEQPLIARVLDTLDATIRQTEAIIAKLKQVKQGLLHDLLTRGIDGNGELRPPHSQAPHMYWDSPLGWVPRDWGVQPLRQILSGPTRNGVYKPSSYHGSGPLMVQMGGLFRGDGVDFHSATRVRVSPSELNAFGLAVGDLLFARRSLVFEGAGLCVILRHLPEPSTFESSIIRARLDLQLAMPEFVGRYLRGSKSSTQRRTLIRQVAVSGVSSDDISQLFIALPCLEEQREIVVRLDVIEERIECEAAAARKLRSQKSGLMDDLLTGRVRVAPLLEDEAVTA